jgi:hypothetical protein
MAADIKQDDLLLADKEHECCPANVRKDDGKAALKHAAQRMEVQMRLERVVLQVGNHPDKMTASQVVPIELKLSIPFRLPLRFFSNV